jgi:hypothetical protein
VKGGEVSCPDWKSLAAWRDDPSSHEPAGWSDALAHFDRGCQDCRRTALAADPTLIFRRLVAVVEPTPAQEASEVDSMRRAVAAMRAASRVEAVERKRQTLSWKRWGLAAVLALAALTLPASDARHPLDQLDPRPDLAGGLLGDLVGDTRSAALAVPASLGDDLPTVDGVNRPGARVYHMDGEGLAVVMIVDETLDV